MRVEAEKAQHAAFLCRREWLTTADQLVVAHASVRQRDSTPGFHLHTRAERKPWAQYDGVEQITFAPYVRRYGAIVEWARERRDEIDVTLGPALKEAATRNFNDYYDRGRDRRCFQIYVAGFGRVVHGDRLREL